MFIQIKVWFYRVNEFTIEGTQMHKRLFFTDTTLF